MWTLIEVEENDITDDLVPNVGPLMLSLSECTAKTPCDSAFMILMCICFLNTLSGMIYVDTLIDVFVEIQLLKIR